MTSSPSHPLGLKGLVTAFVVILSSACTSSSTSSGANPTAPDALSLTSATGAAQGGGNLRVVQELPPPNTQNGGEQPISANDVLEVDVFQVDNLDRTVQVDAAGNISLPLIGTVKAAGTTARQLEQQIENAYGTNYLQSPDVTIFVKESVGQRITVDGEVAKAGIYPVSSNSSLLDAIALAGGFRNVADATKVFVYRDYADAKLVANYNVEMIRSGKKSNPRIYGGDVIVVFTSKSKVAMNNLKEALGVASSAARLAVIP